jgi:hypothetical protein
MKPLSRSVVVWSVLGTALTAFGMASTPGADGTVQPLRSEERPVTALLGDAAQTPHVELERLQQPQANKPIGNAFATTSWYVPPPPPPPPPAQPAPPLLPTAPPLPFTYLGRYVDAPMQLTILLKGDRMYTVKEGEVIEETYRVERVTPVAVELVYLPLNIKQTLSTGESL